MSVKQRMGAARDISTPRELSHLKAIQQILIANQPRGVSSAAPGDSHRSSSKLSAPTGKSRTRSAAVKHDATDSYEDDAAKTRKFWEKYAQEATLELFKDETEPNDELNTQSLAYSGRVGVDPKYPPQIADDESVATDLSLLTCSAIDTLKQKRQKRKRTQAVKKPLEEKNKVDWQKVAMSTYSGVLGRMLNRGANTVAAGGAATSGILNQAQLSELFDPEEQSLLMRAAYMRGLASNEKSGSTENIITACVQSTKLPSSVRKLGVHSGARTPRSKLSASFPNIRVTQSIEQSTKPQGTKIISIFGEVEWQRKSPGGDTEQKRSKIEYRKQVQSQIQRTVNALERITGSGDQQYDIMRIPEENGLYTETDYSLIPRYPQNIRIAPQLVHVITAEMRRRVDEPRQYQLKQKDLSLFDKMQPSLDRSSKNLFIFNWLCQLDERDFIDMTQIEMPEPDYQLNYNHSDVTYDVTVDVIDCYTDSDVYSNESDAGSLEAGSL